MDEDKLRKIVGESVSKAIEPINKRLDGIEGQLDNPDTGLAAINRRLDSNTAAIMELESTVKGYGDMYKLNDNNIRKIEKRLEPLEKKTGVEVSPELHIEPLQEVA